jgi:hypothetical protein
MLSLHKLLQMREKMIKDLQKKKTDSETGRRFKIRRFDRHQESITESEKQIKKKIDFNKPPIFGYPLMVFDDSPKLANSGWGKLKEAIIGKD